MVEGKHGLSRQLRIHSVFGDGDYYQATFEAEQDTDDPESPYLLIQRQIEDPDDDRCYIETHDENYRGHFLLRRVDFTPAEVVNRARGGTILSV